MCVVGYGLGRGYRAGSQLGLWVIGRFGFSELYMRVGNMGMSLLLVNDLDDMYGIA